MNLISATKPRSTIRIIAPLICFTLLLGGCVTTQGAGFDSQSLIEAFEAINPLDTTAQDFAKQVEAGRYDEALSFFSERYDRYFYKRHIKEGRPVSPEIRKLAQWYYDRNCRDQVQRGMVELPTVTSLKQNADGLWLRTAALLEQYRTLPAQIENTNILQVSGVGIQEARALRAEWEKLQAVARRDRGAALQTLFDGALLTGIYDKPYPDAPFRNEDFWQAEEFQKKAFALINAAPESERPKVFKRLSELLAPAQAREYERSEGLKKALARLGPKPIPLDKLPELRAVVKEFGTASGLENAIRIGFVELTAASFKDRNVFDFEVAFDKDLGISIADAKADFMGGGGLSGYDYLFVADLSMAKIHREFRNKREIASQTQTGTRQEPNPAYVTALSDYQRAVTNFQSVKIQNASTAGQPCYGAAWACALAGGLKGALEAQAESEVKRKSESLANTPQELTKPVFSPYRYQQVDIHATKVARVDYYVIDLKKKEVLSNWLEVKDHEKFSVSYNVQELDPSRAGILGSSQKEEDVTAWEKRPVSVKLAAIFDPAHFRKGSKKPFTTVEAFLKPLSSRSYASAKPVFAQGVEPKGAAKSGSAAREGAVADERFESVLIVNTPSALGTGFYVTPDLVLTAYHVVDGSNIVELTFYDGTKTFGKVVDHDVRLDLALIKAQTPGKPVKIHKGGLKLGETAEAIGHPKGYEFTITRGVVSAVRKHQGLMIKGGASVEFVQTDTPISSGNSGGPLFVKDAVVGVNDWARVDKASQNLNFSVSYNEIREYLNRFEGQKK